MKRLMTVLMTLLLSIGCAYAEGLREQIGAPGDIRTTFASPSGKTTVSMNASVEIPDVDAVPVMEVVQTIVPADRVVALADLLIGEGQWSGDADYPAPKPVEDLLSGPIFEGRTEATMVIESAETNINGHPAKNISATSEYQHGGIRGFEGLDYSAWYQGVRFGLNWEPEHALKGQDARGCRYTREEAAAMAREVQRTLAPELTEMVCGVISNEADVLAEGRPEDLEDAYIFYFTRNAMGIPVTYSIQSGVRLDDDANGDPVFYRQPIHYETLRVLVTGNNGVEAVRYETPMELLPPEAADCELLPFESVMNVAEAILPLKYTHLEGSYDEVRLNIDRVTFGYMRVYDAGEMYRWHLVPVWDLFGTYDLVRDGRVIVSHHEDLSSLLTVNAINGIVIDREYGY